MNRIYAVTLLIVLVLLCQVSNGQSQSDEIDWNSVRRFKIVDSKNQDFTIEVDPEESIVGPNVLFDFRFSKAGNAPVSYYQFVISKQEINRQNSFILKFAAKAGSEIILKEFIKVLKLSDTNDLKSTAELKFKLKDQPEILKPEIFIQTQGSPLSAINTILDSLNKQSKIVMLEGALKNLLENRGYPSGTLVVLTPPRNKTMHFLGESLYDRVVKSNYRLVENDVKVKYAGSGSEKDLKVKMKYPLYNLMLEYVKFIKHSERLSKISIILGTLEQPLTNYKIETFNQVYPELLKDLESPNNSVKSLITYKSNSLPTDTSEVRKLSTLLNSVKGGIEKNIIPFDGPKEKWYLLTNYFKRYKAKVYLDKKDLDAFLIWLEAKKERDINTDNISFTDFQIKIDRGSITQVIINDSKSNQYRFNGYVPIKAFSNVNEFDQYTNLTAYSINDNGISINLKDIFQYTPNLISHSEDYSPADTVINGTFSQQNIEQEINIRLLGKSFRKQFSIFTYSDALGLLTKQPNGVVQVEGNLDYMLNARKGSWLLFERAHIGLAYVQQNETNKYLPVRFENGANFKYTNSPNGAFKTDSLGKRFINVYDIIRFARMKFDSRLSILTYEHNKSSSTFRFYCGHQYYYNFLTDSTRLKTRYSTTDNAGNTTITNAESIAVVNFNHISSTYGLGFNYEFRQPQYRIFFDLYMFNMYSLSFDKDLALDKGFLVTDPYSKNVHTTVTDQLFRLPYWKMSAGAVAFLDEEQNKKVVLRLQHYFSPWNSSRGSFWQIQIGYSYSFGVGKAIHSNPMK